MLTEISCQQFKFKFPVDYVLFLFLFHRLHNGCMPFGFGCLFIYTSRQLWPINCLAFELPFLPFSLIRFVQEPGKIVMKSKNTMEKRDHKNEVRRERAAEKRVTTKYHRQWSKSFLKRHWSNTKEKERYKVYSIYQRHNFSTDSS